jgi:hypothetical protein
VPMTERRPALLVALNRLYEVSPGVQGGRGAGAVSGPAVPPALPATAQRAAEASQKDVVP